MLRHDCCLGDECLCYVERCSKGLSKTVIFQTTWVQIQFFREYQVAESHYLLNCLIFVRNLKGNVISITKREKTAIIHSQVLSLGNKQYFSVRQKIVHGIFCFYENQKNKCILVHTLIWMLFMFIYSIAQENNLPESIITTKTSEKTFWPDIRKCKCDINQLTVLFADVSSVQLQSYLYQTSCLSIRQEPIIKAYDPRLWDLP